MHRTPTALAVFKRIEKLLKQFLLFGSIRTPLKRGVNENSLLPCGHVKSVDPNKLQ